MGKAKPSAPKRRATPSARPVAPSPINPATLAGTTGGASAASLVRHPGGLGDEGVSGLPALFAPTPLDPDRPMGARRGPVGWFVLAQAIDAAGESVGKAFGLAKARSLDHANIVADHAQGLAGSAFNRIGARMLLANHRIGTFDAATMSLDERCNAEQSIEEGLTRQSRRELHRCGEGETVKAFEVKADSARSAMIHRLTRLARGLAEEDDVRAGGGGGAPVANDAMKARWFDDATAKALYPALLRNSKKIFHVGKSGRELLYSIADVKRHWPEYATMIDEYAHRRPQDKKPSTR